MIFPLKLLNHHKCKGRITCNYVTIVVCANIDIFLWQRRKEGDGEANMPMLREVPGWHWLEEDNYNHDVEFLKTSQSKLFQKEDGDQQWRRFPTAKD